jgi:hypothetical protein
VYWIGVVARGFEWRHYRRVWIGAVTKGFWIREVATWYWTGEFAGKERLPEGIGSERL